jgi:endonuclease-3
VNRKEKYQYVLNWFRNQMPVAKTELIYSNPYQLLVAVILSAQCTDKRVNLTTPALFKRFPDAESLAAASPDEVFTYIKSISYPNNKAKHLVGMAQKLLKEFEGTVPEKVEDLLKLPGVGRKTAHVIASVIYQKPTMAVDTHVFRVSRRIGLVPQSANTPLKVEKELIKHIPEHEIHKAHHWLILHGRYTCTARNPKCSTCGINRWCTYYKSKNQINK